MDSIEQAIDTLRNPRNRELDRRHAIGYLREHPSAEGVEALVWALGDSDYGVHWAAGDALAALGQRALIPLLTALAQPEASHRLHEGARRVFHNSSSATVRTQTQGLVNSMHGPSSSIEVETQARQLLDTLAQ